MSTPPALSPSPSDPSFLPPASSKGAGPEDAQKRLIAGTYYYIRRIGQGSFASVYLASHRVTGALVAIKSINRPRLQVNTKHVANLQSEINIMKSLKHPNCVAFIDLNATDRHIYLIMEYCGGGDLNKFLKKFGASGLPEPVVKIFSRQLVAGIKFLHSNNIIHRDLKPQNILLEKEFLLPPGDGTAALVDGNFPQLKIADFGFARYIDTEQEEMIQTLCGSPLYMAPELLRYENYNAQADLWSLGAILYEMTTGKTPFTGQNQVQLLHNIEQSQEIRFPPGLNISSELKDLISRLLKKNPLQRMKYQELFDHTFIQGENKKENGGEMETGTAGINTAVAAPVAVRAPGDSERKEEKSVESRGIPEARPVEASKFPGQHEVDIPQTNRPPIAIPLPVAMPLSVAPDAFQRSPVLSPVNSSSPQPPGAAGAATSQGSISREYVIIDEEFALQSAALPKQPHSHHSQPLDRIRSGISYSLLISKCVEFFPQLRALQATGTGGPGKNQEKFNDSTAFHLLIFSLRLAFQARDELAAREKSNGKEAAELSSLQEGIAQQIQTVLQRCSQLRDSLVLTASSSSTSPVFQLIFSLALELCRLAALDELNEKFSAAQSKFKRSQRLLIFLINQRNAATLGNGGGNSHNENQLTAEDERIIRLWKQKISSFIKEGKLENRNEENQQIITGNS